MKWKKFDHETLEAIKALTLSGIILLGIYFVMRDFTNVIDILNSILKALSLVIKNDVAKINKKTDRFFICYIGDVNDIYYFLCDINSTIIFEYSDIY